MPLRDFECDECGEVFEALIMKASEIKDQECPKCQSKNLSTHLSYPANYTIEGNNSASIRPKRMGGGG